MASPIIVRFKKTQAATDFRSKKMTYHSAGFDLCAVVKEALTIGIGEIALFPAGFTWPCRSAMRLQICPRSGLAAKKGITLINSPGTIDADYRGEVMTPVINLGKCR